MPPPSLPIPAKLATALLEALNAVVNGHTPTVGDRRRAATAFIQLTLELQRFEREEPELSAQLDDAMDQAMTPGGFDHPPSIPMELAPTRRGQPARTKPSSARPRKAQHAQEPRPPSADHHRIPRKNCCPCCGRRIPRNRRGQPLTAGTAECPSEGGPALRAGKSSAAPPDHSASSSIASAHTCACSCNRPSTARTPATAAASNARTNPRASSPTGAAAHSRTTTSSATTPRAACNHPTPNSPAPRTTQPTPQPTTPTPAQSIARIALRPHPVLIKLLNHIRQLPSHGHIYCYSAFWAAEAKRLPKLNIPPRAKPP